MTLELNGSAEDRGNPSLVKYEPKRQPLRSNADRSFIVMPRTHLSSARTQSEISPKLPDSASAANRTRSADVVALSIHRASGHGTQETTVLDTAGSQDSLILLNASPNVFRVGFVRSEEQTSELQS